MLISFISNGEHRSPVAVAQGKRCLLRGDVSLMYSEAGGFQFVKGFLSPMSGTEASELPHPKGPGPWRPQGYPASPSISCPTGPLRFSAT